MSIFIKKFLFFFGLAAMAARPSIAADSLVVSPVNPTTMDSIRLSILARDWNCCTQFLYDPTGVTLFNDSMIVLSFTPSLSVVDTLCCIPVTIPVLNYKRGPLPAGNYSVYEEYLSCIGQTCMQDGPFLIAVLIGKFTVSHSAAVLFRQKPAIKENIGKMSGNVRVYDIRGAMVSSKLTRAPKQTSGVYFIKHNDRQAIKLELLH